MPDQTQTMILRSMPALEMAPGDGWTVSGMVMPYNRRQEVQDLTRSATGEVFKISYLERINPQAFARDVANRGGWVNLMVGHEGDEGIRFLGRCIRLESDSTGLYATFRLNRDHPLADQARSGELTGWSAGAHIYESHRMMDPDGMQVIERTSLNLRHVGATASPQYVGAGVALVREHVMIDDVPPVPKAPIRDSLRQKYGLPIPR